MSENRIVEVLNYNEKELSLNMTINDDEKLVLEDVLYNKEELDKEDLINLRNALSNLTKEERELIYERYYENKSQTSLAKEKNISQVKVYRYERKVLDKLKDKME